MDVIAATKKVTRKKCYLAKALMWALASLQTVIMKKAAICVLLLISTVSILEAQSFFSNWTVQGGPTWSNPEVVDNNVTYEVSSSVGFQLEIAKLLPVVKSLDVQLSGALVEMNSHLRDDRDFNFDEQLSLTYVFLETAVRGEREIKKFKPFGAIGIRGNRLIRDNTLDVFFLPYRDTFDYGLSFSVGSEYKLNSVSLLTKINYYNGLSKVVSNSYTDGSGQVFRSEISNRTWALLVGVRF